MLNPFKDLFGPKSVVGLEIGPDLIKAVQVLNGPKRPEVTHLAVKEVKNPDQMQRDLAEMFQDGKFTYDLLVSCVPSSDAVVRQFSLPLDKPAKLDRIIKFQMEHHIPDPIEDMVVDFLPPGPDGDILAVGVRKEALSKHLGLLSGAHLDPKVISIDDLAPFYLYLQNGGRDQSRGVVILKLGRGKRVLQVICGKRLELIRVLPEGSEDFNDIAETLNLYRLKHPDSILEEILLTGEEVEEGQKTAEGIEEKIGVKTTIWRPFDHLPHRLGKISDDLQAGMSTPLGLALGAIQKTSRLLDFRREEFVLSSPLAAGKIVPYVATAVLLVLLVTFGQYYKVHLGEKRYTELGAHMGQILKKSFPDTRVIKGREIEQLRQKIEEGMGRYQWMQSMEKKEMALEILLALTDSVSGFSDVKVENISIEGKEVRLDGKAPSFESVDKLEKTLSASGAFASAKLVGAKANPAENCVLFNFALERRQ